MNPNRRIEIASSNLELLSSRAKITAEQTEISERQLVSLVCEKYSNASLADVYGKYCELLALPSIRQKMLACKYLCSQERFASGVGETVPWGDTDGAPDTVRGEVVYVRNARTDSAFESLRSRNKRVKARYATSMTDACERVWDSTSEFCLIPIENSTDGKLYSFYAMLDRYDLRICDTVSIADGQGTGEIVFALAGRRVLGASELRSKSVVLEFSALSEDTGFISQTVRAANELGACVFSIGTQPSPDADAGNRYYFAVEFDGISPIPMVVYLALERIRYSLIGWYPKHR